MNLIQKLKNRKKSFKVYTGDLFGDDDGYTHGEYKEGIFDIVCSHIMFKFNLNYYWTYTRGIGWSKCFNFRRMF